MPIRFAAATGAEENGGMLPGTIFRLHSMQGVKAFPGINQIALTVIILLMTSMQIDLQEPMELDSVILLASDTNDHDEKLPVSREGNVWWVKHPFHELKVGSSRMLSLYYHGSPRIAVRPPWDGGFSWLHDSTGKLWVSVSCQGRGQVSGGHAKMRSGTNPTRAWQCVLCRDTWLSAMAGTLTRILPLLMLYPPFLPGGKKSHKHL